MKTIAVLLTVFNRKDTTIRCLRNLSVQSIPDGFLVDIYIVDGGSSDGTVEAVRTEFPRVNIKVCDGVFWNRGMYHAWEWAAETKVYDFYLWLNDDTFIYDDCILSLIDAANDTDNKAIIVGATVDTAMKTQVTYGGRKTSGEFIIPDGNLRKVDYFNGNIVLVPAYVYGVLGNLDYYFTHSKGDFDYGMRAGKVGILMFQAGKVLGECDEHPTLDKWCDPNILLKNRWKMLHRPNGMPPKETFHFERRHGGLLMAVFHFFTVYMRCIVPGLWVKLGK